mmetsp:Transcript_20956/g.60511  ORF Transcript_20956/g.60511 Transcript_20956/m.60511 type:complete len:186 (-) Transcript_20956:350-907(-)
MSHFRSQGGVEGDSVVTSSRTPQPKTLEGQWAQTGQCLLTLSRASAQEFGSPKKSIIDVWMKSMHVDVSPSSSHCSLQLFNVVDVDEVLVIDIVEVTVCVEVLLTVWVCVEVLVAVKVCVEVVEVRVDDVELVEVRVAVLDVVDVCVAVLEVVSVKVVEVGVQPRPSNRQQYSFFSDDHAETQIT